MIVEIITFIFVGLFIYLLATEKNLMYVAAAGVGLLAALLLEPQGIIGGQWAWKNITTGLSYEILRVPLVVYLLYAATGGIIFFLNKKFSKLRRTYGKDFDKNAGYCFIGVGVALLAASVFFGISSFLGLVFLFIGIYLNVQRVEILYVGLVVMVADYFFEKAVVAWGQIVHLNEYIGYTLFFGGAIISAVLFMINRKKTTSLNQRKTKRKK
ncbi:MAG: hypothetical protein ABIF92_00630 [archaeon]